MDEVYTDSPKSKAQELKKSPLIEEKIATLNMQNEILGERLQTLSKIVERLRAIGLRFNSHEHPDNAMVGENLTKGEVGEKMRPVDGIIGQLNNVIDKRYSVLKSIEDQLIPDLNRQINYIELHI